MNVPFYADYSNILNPNCYTVGRTGNPVLCLVCHNTAGPNDKNNTDQKTAQALSDAAALYLTSNSRQASVQYLIGSEACQAPIYRIVPEKDTAYHAGGNPPTYPSNWKDPKNGTNYSGFALNQVSIGIEVFGQVNEVVGPNQKAAISILLHDITSRNQILLDPKRIVSHKEVEPGDRFDGVNWVDYARALVTGGFNMPLPYGAIIDTAGNIHVNGFIVGFGFRDYWIKMAGADPNAVISSATITRAARVWGLPVENEHTDADGIARQRFQRYIMNYDKNQTGDWQFSGQFIN